MRPRFGIRVSLLGTVVVVEEEEDSDVESVMGGGECLLGLSEDFSEGTVEDEEAKAAVVRFDVASVEGVEY